MAGFFLDSACARFIIDPTTISTMQMITHIHIIGIGLIHG